MFYESQNSLNSDIFKLETGFDFSFQPHLHSAFELIHVTEGLMQVAVDNIQYDLSVGDAVLVFPNQVHSLHTPQHSRHELCIFAPELVRAFNPVHNGKIPNTNQFKPDQHILKTLSNLSANQTLLIKGTLYSLCGQFDMTAQYHDRAKNSDGLLAQIFRFVEEHQVVGKCQRAFYTQIGFAMRIVLRTLNCVNETDGNQLKQLMRDNRHLLRCLCQANIFFT